MELTKEQKEKIKEIWLNKRNLKRSKEIFSEDLKEFFPEGKWLSKEWAAFMTLLQGFRKEEERKEINERAKGITAEEAMEIQDDNRKRTIVLLSKLLKKYEEDPRKLARIDMTKLYQIIQAAEEAIKRTEIMMHKEKRETVRMFFPYQRMSIENILKLREKINESFERLLQLKSQPAGPVE